MRTQKLDAMLSGMMDCLKENGCAISYLSKIEMECHQFKRYAEKLGTTHFYPALCKRYLSAKYGNCCSDREKRTSHHELTIRLMEWLKEYAESGAVCMAQRSSRVYVIPDYEDILQSYLYCQEQNGLKPKTISHKRHCLLLLFEYLETIGVTSVEQVNASHFYGYLERKHCLSVTTKEAILYVLRDFIRYLTDRNLCNPKLSGLSSVISTHGKNAYPSYFKNDEVKRLVQSADTETAVGKRDYAGLLLAAELGLRTGDIVAMKTDYLLWNERRIELLQQKTGKFLSLPMSEELFLPCWTT
ncbi:hypothetical protein A7X67_17225 [Clostridium sp. W14A]|nr:hypothetical protein A7X67_17225 [Clostridium sp. W14A]